MELALVDDAHGLAFGPCDGLRSHEMDLGADAQHGAHSAVQGLLAGLYVRDLIGELLGGELDVDVEGIRVVLAVDDYLIVGGVAL